jgi:heme-degrading monooxygenase HmoA
MFARVITAQSGTEGVDGAIRLAEQQLPGARQMPGFNGYYLLTDAETGKLIIISLWETREQLDAVTAGAGASGIRHPGRGHSSDGTYRTAPGNLRSRAARLIVCHKRSAWSPVSCSGAGQGRRG